jgi:hypothetical protein
LSPRLAQRAQTPGQAGELHGLPAEHIHVVERERGEASDVRLALQGAEDRAEPADLVLHTVVIVLADIMEACFSGSVARGYP